MANPKDNIPRSIVVLGAGVQGLTVACLLLSEGHSVTIVAKGTPESLESDELYASNKAGGNWQSYAVDTDLRLQGWDEVTFRAMWTMAGSNRLSSESGIRRTVMYQYYPTKPVDWKPHWFGERGVSPNYKVLKDSWKFPEGVAFGVEFETHAPKYISFLAKKFKCLGGQFSVRKVDRLSDLYNENSKVDVVINCSGLGSRKLGDVMDESVIPGRGQIMVVYAPHIKFTLKTKIGESFGEQELGTYVIPREGGYVVLGGTYQIGNSDLTPDPEIAKGIMERCVAACPELLSPDGSYPTILDHSVGLRPVRKGGVRLESSTQC
ncbi:hypothetical protein HK096_003370 [Nowakowskiella sp. JEL0078]|nr:hypothetical protein HK096_003370 [Nowakowskiella sp. JEL0078]